ncbi:deoxyribonuclease V [Dyadobacter sp. CY323]|uniref:deoxyribonuclease V n=1 Tax=Dyadobacter sp. CY323 TaxID=2907302 RepID=UPI001EEA6DA8|nr:deoxyribonuclease V [Dyadobacter sp. CY323]MCE6990860.1 deoxyribonuclease V [Dyadobacter sp. CY323]
MPADLIQNAPTPESNYDQLTISEATVIQRGLIKFLKLNPLNKPITSIAGADISLSVHDEAVYAGMVILSFPDLQPVSYSLVKSSTTFPYVPGYLAFREIPSLLKAYEQIPIKPDIVMFDGNGILHARRMGIASHFGVLTDTATLGCAKSKLAGKYDEPGENKGDFTVVIDRSEQIGYAVRTKNNVKPVFISPGNNMNLQDSLTIALKCVGKHRLPEPTRRAHEMVNLFRTGQLEEGFHEVKELRLF